MWIWGTNGWKEGRGKRLLTGAGRLSRYFYPKCFLPHFLVWAASRQRQSVLREKNGMRNISTPDTLDFTLNFFLGVNHTSEDKILDTLLLLMLPLGFYIVFFKIKCVGSFVRTVTVFIIIIITNDFWSEVLSCSKESRGRFGFLPLRCGPRGAPREWLAVTAIMTRVVLVLFECFKQSSI